MPAPHYITHNGETLTRNGWAKRIGLTHHGLQNRLAAGWTMEAALSPERRRPGRRPALYTHEGETLTLAQWAAYASVDFDTLRWRVRAGWPLARALTEVADKRRRSRKQ